MAHDGTQPNRLALLTGFGIGIVWVVSALYFLFSAYRGFADHRPDYGMSWSLAGALLLGAGAAALIGTWWHQLRKPRADH